MTKTISLTTDYLIIGAGTMGMCFLDELINNSTSLKAIIVDQRDKPGGHWNDAYPFVRLHQPAVTYGVNSRPLGEGDLAGVGDLASKSQILSHLELALADLVATGRVTFLSQCRHQGEGKLVSLLDPDLTYQVKYNRKLVDATQCETKIPSTSKPNFTVEDDVNFVPVNGLARVRASYDHYMIVGGGKTGIDAVLHLLDHGVNPYKISWIVPNDSWFFNRDSFKYNENIITMFEAFFGAFTVETDTCCEDVYLSLERAGVMLRLDKNLLPTRNRLATLSTAELDKLSELKNIIRKGRLRAITGSSLVFLSGEQVELEENTLVVDCAVNGIKFKPKTKIFQGNKIILQYIMIPPIGKSTSAIVAMELKYPEDDEKKNSVCLSMDIPETAEDYFLASQINGKVEELVRAELGLVWMRSRRCYDVHHLTITQLLSFLWMAFTRGGALNRKIDLCVDKIRQNKH